ncbi:MAG: transglutaminase family protein, partial [Ktedonobacteraceae bacterium]
NEPMRKRLLILLLTLLVLLGISGSYVVEGLQAYSHYQQSSFANQQHCGGQPPVHICVRVPAEIFSAFYAAYVANQYPLFTLDYSSSSPLTLIANMSISGLSQVQAQTINATPELQTVSIIPPLLSQNLRKLTSEDHTFLHVQVTDTSRHLYYMNDIPVLFHSRWLMQWVAANRLKIGAWVTPNDSAISALVLKASKHLAIQPPPVPNAMVGYNKANSKEVIAQVDALYDTLRLDYTMHYLQASVPYSGPGSNTIATQNVKLPAEVLQQHSGMCIELTLLLASAVERIGLHPEIVIIPGHAFLGVAVTPDNKHFEYWDAVQVNANIAGDSANIATDAVYEQNQQQHTIVDTILISDARDANIYPML